MKRLLELAVLGTLLACGGADSPVAPVPPSSATSDIVPGGTSGPYFTGRSVAVDATVLDVNTKLCDTGPLPSTGGRLVQNLAASTIPGLMSASEVVCGATTVANWKGVSEATLWKLNLTVGGTSISADWLHSMAGARCPAGLPPANSGSAFVQNLRVNGRWIEVRRDTPNQRIALPNGYAVFNEHSSFTSPWHAGRTVIGLRVVINKENAAEMKQNARAEILVARTQMHADCPSA